jgi:heat shock protein HtpX
MRRAVNLKLTVRALRLSPFERHATIAGLLTVVGAVVSGAFADDAGGTPRAIGSAGLVLLVLAAAARAARLYRDGVTASLPTSVARVRVRTRPHRAFGLLTIALALLLPLGAAVAAVALVKAGWLLVAAVLVMGFVGVALTSGSRGEAPWSPASAAASGLLERLCMRADMRVPKLVVDPGPVPNAWTASGRIHVTAPLLELLDDAELEAVLAHELAHLAHRDAAVMEIASGPCRVLLAFVDRLVRWASGLIRHQMFRMATGMVFLGILCGPSAFVIGWISRLSVLGMSRAREFAADAAAATLTGRPSALASALLKLDDQREWLPRADLREVEAFAMLCVVGAESPRFGRLLSTHPPVAARVKRLEETEARIQAAGHPGRLWDPGV